MSAEDAWAFSETGTSWLGAPYQSPPAPRKALLLESLAQQLALGQREAAPRNSKVLSLVMQVLSNMVTTSTAPPLLNSTHTSLPAGSPSMGEYGMVPVIVIGVIFAIATTLGNLMVMMDMGVLTLGIGMIYLTNSLSASPGFISIPLMTYYTSTGYWDIGWGLCQFWLCLDYLMSNASVLNLLLISFDRYFSITRPLTYRPRRTTKKALLAMFSAYAFSLALWPPWILSWPLIEDMLEGRSPSDPGQCVVPFLSPGAKGRWAPQMATVATCFFAFYLPVTIMIYLYYRVYCETRRRTAEFRKLQAGQHEVSQQSLLPDQHLYEDAAQPPERRISRTSIHSMVETVRSRAAAATSTTCFGLLKLRQVRQFEEATNDSLRESSQKAGSIKKQRQILPFMDSMSAFQRRRSSKDKFFWLRYCVGKAGTEIDSEESSETNVPTTGADWISGKTIEEITSMEGTPITPIATNNLGGSGRFRHRTTTANEVSCTPITNNNNRVPASSTVPVLHTYTVLIEYRDGENKRPSVRLSSCDSDAFSLGSPINSNRSSKRIPPAENGKRRDSIDDVNNNVAAPTAKTSAQLNGRSCNANVTDKQREEQFRKSEKERRKNERRQESKAAKTLSAILFAFIVTWTPYNVIVCWEAFYPNSVPEILFTISYFLCYVNSTINPICYACNGRFLKTYVRILRCQFWKKDRHDSLYRHAYLRR